MLTLRPAWMENPDMGFLDWPKKGTRPPEKRFILAIDGGGMRGLIPARIIAMMAERLREMGDMRPLYSHFDMIAGTSTGALIAAALAIPTEGTAFQKEEGREEEVTETRVERRRLFRSVTIRTLRGRIIRTADPASLASFYIDHGPEIFPQRGMTALLGPLFTDKYSGSTYSRFLQDLYGEAEMSSLLVPTVLTSYASDYGMIYPITSWDNHGYRVWEGARASSAAPLYFPAFSAAERDTGRTLKLIDGGIASNNPSAIAYALAKRLYPEADEFHILSLSTAEPVYRSYDAGSGGIAGWGGQISRIFQNASLQLSETIMEAVEDVRYTRIWAPVLEKRIRLDATGKDAIDELLEAAERMYSACREETESYLSLIASSPTPEGVKLRAASEPLQRAPAEGSGGNGA